MTLTSGRRLPASFPSASTDSNLQWSHATYLLLVETHVRDEAFGLAPDGRGD